MAAADKDSVSNHTGGFDAAVARGYKAPSLHQASASLMYPASLLDVSRLPSNPDVASRFGAGFLT